MEKWIGNRPTLEQKNLANKHKSLLTEQCNVITSGKTVLKVIEAEFDKKLGADLKGLLILTEDTLYFVSKRQHFTFTYASIQNITYKKDGKDKNEWELSFTSGSKKYAFDDIKKSEDTDEFIEILQYVSIGDAPREVLTTTNHDFNTYLDKQTQSRLKAQGVKITSFLIKRDNLGLTKNGERHLRSKHQNAVLVAEGFYQEENVKKGNFIVVEQLKVLVYLYDNKIGASSEEVVIPFIEFSHSVVDHFAIKSEVKTSNGLLVLNTGGKSFVTLLESAGISLNTKERKWYQKILGFRSGKVWKSVVASFTYTLALLLVLIMVVGGEDSTSNSASTKPETKTEEKTNQQDTSRSDKVKETSTVPSPSYTITNERLDDSGTWYVTAETEVTDEDSLKNLSQAFIEEAKSRKNVTSTFLNMTYAKGGEAHIANAKFALTNKGLAQTGLSKVEEIEFEYLPDNIEEVDSTVTESSSKYSADDVLSAFKNANLSVKEPRDNTSKQCKSDGLNCTQLITTEDVSIYLWPSEELAVKNASNFSHQSGAFTIRFNKPKSPENEYIKVIDTITNS